MSTQTLRLSREKVRTFAGSESLFGSVVCVSKMKHDDIKSALDKNRVYGAVLKETPQERTKDQGWIDADGCQNADLQWTLQKKETQNTLLVPDSKDFIKNQGWSHLNSSNHQDDQDALIIWEQDGSRKKRTIWKNVLIVGLGFFFFFTGMSPMTLMQSSLNSEDGIGVAALAVKNAFMILGSLAATSILFKFGCKWTMVIAGFIYSIYVMANFYPTWYTMIPAACLSGTAATVLWTAQRVYFAKLAHLYSSIFDMDVDRVQSRMFMLLTICFKLSATVGNAVSSVILGTQSYQNFMSSARLLICGAVYCNEEFEPSSSSSSSPPTSVNSTLGNVKDLYEPGQLQVYGLCAFCLVCCLLGSSILSFIDPLKNLGLCETPKHSKSLKTLVVEAACQMKDPRHILLIPLAMMASGGDSFWAADFSKVRNHRRCFVVVF